MTDFRKTVETAVDPRLVLMFSVFSFVCNKSFGDCNSPQKQEKPRIIHATIALDSC